MEDLDADKVVDADNVAETDLVPVRLVVVDLVVVTLRLRLRVLVGVPKAELVRESEGVPDCVADGDGHSVEYQGDTTHTNQTRTN